MPRKIYDIEEKLINERELLAQGYKYLAGVDEVGRGPLAGPVVCAAVIMPLDEDSLIIGVDDSKKLSEKKREELSAKILEKAIAYKICLVDHERIDEINILNATKECMCECINGLAVKPDVVLIDALELNVEHKCKSLIGGDAKSYMIGAASIIAKVYRDRLMLCYDAKYPEYGFAKNKGYGTKAHIDAIKEVGPCPIHRRTFIKNFWVQKES
jgi:ribonuclease HII